MTLYMVRGTKAPFQRNLSFTVANYLSGDIKEDIEAIIDRYPDHDWREFREALDSETLTAWGATDSYETEYGRISPGDRVLYWNAYDDRIEYEQSISLLLGSEAPLSARNEISELLWRSDDYRYLWFSTEPVVDNGLERNDFESEIEEVRPGFDLRDDWFPTQGRIFP